MALKRRQDEVVNKKTRQKKKLRKQENDISNGFEVKVDEVHKKITLNDIRKMIGNKFNARIMPGLLYNTKKQVERTVILCVKDCECLKLDASVLKKVVDVDCSKPMLATDLLYKDFQFLWPMKLPGSNKIVYPSLGALMSWSVSSGPISNGKDHGSGQNAQSNITVHNLLMTKAQLVKNNYPIDQVDWPKTQDFEHEGSHIFALDCEMCLTKEGPALTRISLTNFDNEVIMDELVLPSEPITDYLYKYSGINEEKLKNVTTTLEDVQKKLLSVVSSQDVLIGHSLESDLNALRIRHETIIDTAIIYDHLQNSSMKPSLKWLVSKYLNREIQVSQTDGHDSVEDAVACMDLVKLKIQNGINFGKNLDKKQVSLFTALSECPPKSSAAESPEHSKSCLCVNVQSSGNIVCEQCDTEIGQSLQKEKDEEVADAILEQINDKSLIVGNFVEPENDKLPQVLSRVVENCPPKTFVLIMALRGQRDRYDELFKQRKNYQNNKEGQWTLSDDEEFQKELQRARCGVCMFQITK